MVRVLDSPKTTLSSKHLIRPNSSLQYFLSLLVFFTYSTSRSIASRHIYAIQFHSSFSWQSRSINVRFLLQHGFFFYQYYVCHQRFFFFFFSFQVPETLLQSNLRHSVLVEIGKKPMNTSLIVWYLLTLDFVNQRSHVDH